MVVYVRTTVMLDDDIFYELKSIQEELVEKETRHVSFSEVVRLMAQKGLK